MPCSAWRRDSLWRRHSWRRTSSPLLRDLVSRPTLRSSSSHAPSSPLAGASLAPWPAVTRPRSRSSSPRWPQSASTSASSLISQNLPLSNRGERHQGSHSGTYNRAVDLLIVDDESSLRDFLSIVFEEEGWHVET